MKRAQLRKMCTCLIGLLLAVAPALAQATDHVVAGKSKIGPVNVLPDSASGRGETSFDSHPLEVGEPEHDNDGNLSPQPTTRTQAVAASGAAPADGWQIALDVYLWGASIDGKTAAGDPVSVSIGDLLGALEFGFMTSVGVRKDRFVLLTDLIFLNVGEVTSQTFTIDGEPINVSADLELDSWIVNMAGGYTAVQTDKTSLDVVGGARYLDMDAGLRFDIGPETLPPLSYSFHVWDGIFGIRGTTDLPKNWKFTYYVDVGTGNSDFTWQALAGFGYRIKKMDVIFGYRYLQWNLDESGPGGSAFDDMKLHGPYGGIRLVF